MNKGRRPENESPAQQRRSIYRTRLLAAGIFCRDCLLRQISSATRTAIAVLFTVWPATADLAGG